MLIENFLPDMFSKEPLYLQIGQFIKQQIRSGQLPPGTKLPSIRHLAAALQISRTTAETCYSQLMAEGFLESLPQKGYYVADLLLSHPRPAKTNKTKTNPVARYDFANNYVDATTFPAALWRRHVSRALRDKELLSGYGDPQGELLLRQVLAEYSQVSRGVLCTPEQIVIGAGIQSLLEILAAVLQDTVFQKTDDAGTIASSIAPTLATAPVSSIEPMTSISSTPSIALEEPGFLQAEEIFKRKQWKTDHFAIENLNTELPPVLYVSPSNPYKGRSLTPEQRRSLIRWSMDCQTYILEDDYNGEFRYFSTPVTSLQGMSNGDYIIYLGSFSRLLLPSLRLSYAVLPATLLPAYEKVKKLYNQTSSTIEQLALAYFIKEGSLRRHVKKLKHLYKEKNTLLRQCLSRYFGDKVQILSYESGLHMRIAVQSQLASTELTEKALAVGVRVIPVKKKSPLPEFLLSFAGIQSQDIEPAVKLLSKCWK